MISATSSVERAVGGVAGQGVAQRVDADLVHQLVERHDRPGALRQAHLLTVAHDLDHLADQHVQRLRRVVTDARGHRPQPTDVAVVVGAEQVDAVVEAASALVEVVGGVRGEVRQLAVGPDEHPVLVVAEVRGAHPQRAVGLEEVPVVLEAAQGVGHRAVRLVGMEVALGEPHVEVGVEAVELVLLLLQLQRVARLAEGGEPLALGQVDDVRLPADDPAAARSAM